MSDSRVGGQTGDIETQRAREFWPMTAGELAEFVGARLVGPQDMVVVGLAIDSREVKPGEAFVCIRGESVDGHDFIAQAVERGAAAVVVDGDEVARAQEDTHGRAAVLALEGQPAVSVLQELARKRAGAFRGTVIGITGSAGKTTTRELIRGVLGTRLDVLAAERNLNTEIGLPLAVSRARGTEDVWVLEYGARKKGDIALLTDIVAPDWAVITSIGYAHLGIMGSREEIYREKTSILAREKTRVAFLSSDDDFTERIRAAFSHLEFITAGFHPEDAVRIENFVSRGCRGSSFQLVTGSERVDVAFRLPGRHNAILAALAAAVGLRAGISLEEAARALEEASPVRMRLEGVSRSGYLFINDTYNANPASMRAALAVLADEEPEVGGVRVAILGDMLELGDETESLHRELGEALAHAGVELVIYLGEQAAAVERGFRLSGGHGSFVAVASHEEAARRLKAMAPSGSVVLLKGSRALSVEKVLDYV